ncbi:hypothetical protein ACSCBZ_41765 [Streptomyces niveiscabiei]|uniref:hypothetical protein n=1 Tax=Streptomyces niveiscabiei TaxID=164115 RepID=UPI000A94E1A4|nr:hypothetical protein [Streptomyces niveiscabiei]
MLFGGEFGGQDIGAGEDGGRLPALVAARGVAGGLRGGEEAGEEAGEVAVAGGRVGVPGGGGTGRQVRQRDRFGVRESEEDVVEVGGRQRGGRARADDGTRSGGQCSGQ